jgi:hypothetical protein
MTYPLVRELAEDGIPVTVTCRVELPRFDGHKLISDYATFDVA